MKTVPARQNVSTRTQARICAVQALYQVEIAGMEPSAVINQFLGATIRPFDSPESEEPSFASIDHDWASAPFSRGLFRRIMLGVTEQQQAIDERLAPLINRQGGLAHIDMLLRAILRAGTFELVIFPSDDAPMASVINDYLHVTKAFFPGGETKLVNAILDRIAKTGPPGGGDG